MCRILMALNDTKTLQTYKKKNEKHNKLVKTAGPLQKMEQETSRLKEASDGDICCFLAFDKVCNLYLGTFYIIIFYCIMVL